jgi:DNA-binding PadR family transcriptional regulator
MRKATTKRPPRRGARAMRNGLQEAILGLLAIRPMSGYDLSRSYQRALQQIWYAPLGQVYPTARRMHVDGLLKVSVQVQRNRPNRKVYSLTEAGRDTLVEWLLRPAALPNMHHEFIHKLFLLNQVEPSRRIELVAAYIERSTAWVAELRRIAEKLETALDGPHGESAAYQLMSLRHLRRIVECEAASARQIASEIKAKLNLQRKDKRDLKRKKNTKARRKDHLSAHELAFGGLSLSPAKFSCDPVAMS